MPGVLEIFKLLLLFQISFKVFFLDVIVLNLGQGGVVLVVCANVSDMSLNGFE